MTHDITKNGSSEIAQSRERFEQWARQVFDQEIHPLIWDAEVDGYADNRGGFLSVIQPAYEAWLAAERDTRERVANLVKLVLIQVTGPDGFLVNPAELEELLAERIRGKE